MGFKTSDERWTHFALCILMMHMKKPKVKTEKAKEKCE
jgi:hypothetical protein